MRKQTIYQLNSLYRDAMKVTGYFYGKGEPTLCIMGALRGNEIQQLYICSQLNKRLKQLEREGQLCPGKEVLIIPTANSSSINVGKRFWPSDNTDINRMFPGYRLGETTQRIADGVFEAIRHYKYGIHFCSFYMSGTFLTHVRMMHTNYEDLSLAGDFGLPYTIVREPKPYDTTTLNYNWQIWETEAFSVYTSGTEQINQESAEEGVEAVLRFMEARGILRPGSTGLLPIAGDKKNRIQLDESKSEEDHAGSGMATGEGQSFADSPSSRHNASGKDVSVDTKIVWEKDMSTIKCDEAGLFIPYVKVGQEVEEGELLAEILDPYIGEVRREIVAEKKGKVFFRRNKPVVYANTVVFRII